MVHKIIVYFKDDELMQQVWSTWWRFTTFKKCSWNIIWYLFFMLSTIVTKKRSVIPCNPMDISLATAISRGRSGCTSNMQSLNLFIQTTLFDTFNQTRVAGRSIRKVFKTTILSALLKLNVWEGVDTFTLKYD